MLRFVIGALGAPAIALPATAQVQPFPAGIPHARDRDQRRDDPRSRRRQGPAVVLLHGYGETGDMWVPMAADLARDHTVVVPDLRGLGLSSKPAAGFDKKTQAGDVAGVLDALKIERADLVTHDIGNMVGYAFAAQHPERVTRFVLIDAPVPGVGPWEEVLKNPLLWHFRFGGPDMERLVAGRERIYLDRFWNEFSADAQPVHRGVAGALREALRAARRDALGLRAVRRVRSGCDRQPGLPRRQGQARDAGAGDRRREIVRPDDGGRHALCRQRRDRRRHSRLRPLDHGGEPDGDDRHGPRLPLVQVTSTRTLEKLGSWSFTPRPLLALPARSDRRHGRQKTT